MKTFPVLDPTALIGFFYLFSELDQLFDYFLGGDRTVAISVQRLLQHLGKFAAVHEVFAAKRIIPSAISRSPKRPAKNCSPSSTRTETVSPTICRRLHNLALDLGWLPWPILAKRAWPKIRSQSKRAITAEEHAAVIASEENPERRAYYELLYETGAAREDWSCIAAESMV